MSQVYVSDKTVARILRAGLSVPEFVKETLNGALDALEAKAKAPAQLVPPPPPPVEREPTAEEIEAALASVEISFDHLGKKDPSPPTGPSDRIPVGLVTEVPHDVAGRFALGEPSESDLRIIAEYVRRKHPTSEATFEQTVAFGRSLAEITRTNPITTDRSWIQIHEQEIGRSMSGPERMRYLRDVRRKLGLKPRPRLEE